MDNEPGESYDIGRDTRLGERPLAETVQLTALMSNAEYYEKMRTLNTMQRKVVLDFLYHVETSDEQVCRFISGGAGVGKTHTTHMLYQSVLRHYTKSVGADPNDVFILKHNILSDFQFGYRSQHSTTHAILNICDNILKNFDNKKSTPFPFF